MARTHITHVEIGENFPKFSSHVNMEAHNDALTPFIVEISNDNP
jgi:hypothetical protein